jgi:hypothetical protein
MLDINSRLKQLTPYHIPSGFNAKKGVAKNFKILSGGSPCKMSMLDGAVHSFGTASANTPSQEVSGTYMVMADWCGNWFFDFYLVTQAGGSGNGGAGFVFDYSNDGLGHGYTTTGGYSNGSDSVGRTDQSISGNDTWISENWVNLTAESFRVGVGNATGAFSGSPDIVSYTLENSGFATLQNLGGASPGPVDSGNNVDGSCWYAVSSAWGVPPYSCLGGLQNDPAEGIDAPGPAYPWQYP